ncbi:hypothetical protein BV25DRAFT_1817405 [Artomyces pyxidatus]|uniref:Uncharacterized protein n=1 Tax=Artomyces pyxidatus TaxID=48021 RepID=A0ACB8TJH3_9AGAM|nr:hypothetical protein BV25DRAFT_1817405 [Artomyces pyxidatus]
MDPFHFDAYTSYSDASTPRTPSPRADDIHSPAHFKLELEPVRNIFADPMADESAVAPEGHSMWSGIQHASLPFNNSRGSLLGELYDHDLSPPADNHPSYFLEQQHQQQHIQLLHQDDWHPAQHRATPHHHQQQDLGMMRRATYPYVRQDRDDPMHYSQPSFIPQDCEPMSGSYSSRIDTLYGEPLPLMDSSPQLISLGPDHSMHNGRYDLSGSLTSSPASSYVEFDKMDANVKLEESAPVIVPSQTCLYRPPSSGAMHPLSYLSPHTGLPVQHTDDASSKETQYLRRRCFNCSQTEPPSWRRSTLNPGKIVCNKCGLYERTHLRPRPLRFDELRTGNKSRKQAKGVSGSPASKLIKKEAVEAETMTRRQSVSSSSGSVHSSSDWDDSVSVYSSSGSAPPSSFNSPSPASFSLPLERSSQSPPLAPRDGGIRLPNTPLSDVASLQSPRKSATSPDFAASGMSQGDYFGQQRRPSLPVDVAAAPRTSSDLPEVTGWQTVPMADVSSSAKSARGKQQPQPSVLRKAVVA